MLPISNVKRLLLTPGEPAGIGPEIVSKIAGQAWPCELIVVADPVVFPSHLQLIEADLSATPEKHQANTLKIIPVSLKAPVTPGQLNTLNASYVIETLEIAAQLCLQKKADTVVTGPVHKGILNEAGFSFRGHTEFFAEQAGVTQTVMLFVANQLKIALATTHLPLTDVPRAITRECLYAVIKILSADLTKWFGLATPRISVCGLNPHAGEQGHLGREEIDTIIPALNELRELGYTLNGPLPADTAFTPEQLNQTDAVLAMYHDQALPLVKYLGFGGAVNVTLGLPFVRTSVDHGTALDIAGTGRADAGSLSAAMQTALSLLK